MTKLYLATGPSPETVIGIYSDDQRAMEAANAKAEVSLDWEQAGAKLPHGGWAGSSPVRYPLRNPFWPPFRVRPVELDDGSLSGFAYALDPDDARDLRTLISERLGGETIPDAYDRARADRAEIGPAEDSWKCPGCGWASHECMCEYPCRPCFDHDGVPLPTADEIGQDARSFPHDDPCPRCGRRQWGLGPGTADPANPTDAEQATCGACGYVGDPEPDESADLRAAR